jgi:hypothetical protein
MTEPWWLRGLIEHNQFLTLDGEFEGSTPVTGPESRIYGKLIRIYGDRDQKVELELSGSAVGSNHGVSR